MIINMKKISALLLTTSLVGCSYIPAVGPDYDKPEIPVNSYWNFSTSAPKDVKILQETPETETPTADGTVEVKEEIFDNPAWWENFNDPVLNQLIGQAVEKNYDLKTAISRVKEARANRLSEAAVLLPEVDATGSVQRNKQRSPFSAKPLNTYQAGFDSIWEIDIFGGQRRRFEAAENLVEAAEADQQNVLISLRAEVARNYMEVRNFQSQIDITLDNIKSQGQSLDLTRSQRDAGIVSDLDVSQAQSLYFSTSSRLPTLQTSLEQAKNNLSTLLGEQPGKLDEILSQVQRVPVAGNKFLIQTPATVIANRPDVKAAERQLAAATALQGAAFAEYFPKLSLTGFFGYQHNELVPGGNIWSLGGNAVMPILDFGRVRAGVRVADAQQEQAFNNFQQTVLIALSEVQTNLVTYVNEEKRYEYLASAVASNKKAVELSKARYDTGIAAFTDVLIAQGELYSVESQLAQSEANVAENLIALNKSLGR